MIDPYQSAYIHHHTTETVIINIFDNVLQILSKHRQHQFLIVDLSDVFDTIDHEILIQRLIAIGLCKLALQ